VDPLHMDQVAIVSGLLEIAEPCGHTGQVDQDKLLSEGRFCVLSVERLGVEADESTVS
jgi:hypothetical protein